MAISPASAANYDWFLDTLCRRDQQAAEATGRSVHALLAGEIDAALAQALDACSSTPTSSARRTARCASAGFLGLRGWHDRGTLLRAVLEGIAFNHRVHIDALRDGFAVREARLTGGASRNPAFAQMFADVLGDAGHRHRRPTRPPPGAPRSAPAPASASSPRPRTIRATSQRLGTTYAPDPARSRRLRRPLPPVLPHRRDDDAALARDRRAGREPAMTETVEPEVVILGAGINGAGLFRDLCEQGVRCLIVDKADFGSGTSAAPSRLIHGGLKYLETGELGLVAQSTLERNLLLRNAPHCVEPLPDRHPDLLLDPRHRRRAAHDGRARRRAPRSRGALLVKVGLALYDFYGCAPAGHAAPPPRRPAPRPARHCRRLPRPSSPPAPTTTPTSAAPSAWSTSWSRTASPPMTLCQSIPGGQASPLTRTCSPDDYLAHKRCHPGPWLAQQ